MYNAETKERYLVYNKKANRQAFERVASYEVKMKKDICKMTVKELFEYFYSLKPPYLSYGSMQEFKKYIEWCRALDMCENNVLSDIRQKDFIELYSINQYEFYISENDMKRHIDIALNSDYGVYMASCLLAAYEGIAGDKNKNLAHLRLKDIDKNKCLVTLYDGRVASISKKLVDMLFKTASIHEISMSRNIKLLGSLYPDSIWNIPSALVTEQTVIRRMHALYTEARKMYGETEFSKNALERSGCFNRIMKTMLEDGITKEALLKDADTIDRATNKKYWKYFENNEEYSFKGMRNFVTAFYSFIKQY